MKNSTSPLRMMETERVCMKAFIPSRATQNPLKSPSRAPMDRVRTMAVQGLPSNPGNHFTDIRTATPGAKARTASMDRSRFPLMRTNPWARTSMLMMVVW